MNPEFLQHLHALVQYERAYHNFGFIVQKGNLSGIRRDVCFFMFNYFSIQKIFFDRKRSVNAILIFICR